NGTGLTALILIILSILAPIAIVIVGNVMARDNGQSTGTVIVSTAIAVFVASAVSIALVFFGIVVGIFALFRRNRGKVLAFIAIGLGLVPVVVVTMFALVFGDAIPSLFT